MLDLSSVPSMGSVYPLDSSAGLEPSGMEPLAAAFQAIIISAMPVFNVQQELTSMEKPAPHHQMHTITALPTRSTSMENANAFKGSIA